MKCYYEILEVDRDADDGEIKTAYRRMALKWHPDKNLDNTELAKEQFQLVQQAYDVLGDRQERAWYDKHRESILRGASSEYKDEFLDVFQYFTTSCFRGFGDDAGGFYGVYRAVFDKLIEEDMRFIDDKDEFMGIPKFGDSASDYDEVVRPFYDHWTSYSTKKTFTWLDPHDVRAAGNRRVLKIIEKENEKVRQKAKRERNEEVRNLVAFIRKRDKRVQAHVKVMETRKIENRQKQQRLTKERKLQRIQQLNDSGNQAEWMRFDNVRSELEEIEKSLANEFGESDDENCIEDDIRSNLYCVACNKIFKNANAFGNHESSKKHKENVGRLKESMLEDDRSDTDFDETRIDSSSEVEEGPSQKSKKKNKSRRNRNLLKPESSDSEPGLKPEPLPAENTNEDEPAAQFQSSRPKRERQKKRKTKEPAPSTSSNKVLDTALCCARCRSEFPSKNKLFEHLKKTGHGVALHPPPNKRETRRDDRRNR